MLAQLPVPFVNWGIMELYGHHDTPHFQTYLNGIKISIRGSIWDLTAYLTSAKYWLPTTSKIHPISLNCKHYKFITHLTQCYRIPSFHPYRNILLYLGSGCP